MKKHLTVFLLAGIAVFVACGDSKLEQEKKEKAKIDSIAFIKANMIIDSLLKEKEEATWLKSKQPETSITISGGETGIPFDFTKGFLLGIPLGDIKYRNTVFGRPIIKTDFDKTLKDMGEYDRISANSELYNTLKNEVNSAWDFYSKMDDYRDYTTRRAIPNTEIAKRTAWELGLTPDILPLSQTIKIVQLPKGSEIYKYGLGGQIQVKTKQEIANAIGSVMYRGSWIPMSMWRSAEGIGSLKLVTNLDTSNNLPAYYWQVIEQGER